MMTPGGPNGASPTAVDVAAAAKAIEDEAAKMAVEDEAAKKGRMGRGGQEGCI
jgi:hypothetical protein